MWGEQNQQLQWHVVTSFHLERIWACACVRDRYHLSPSDTQNAHLQKCGRHLHETRLWAASLEFCSLSTVARGTSRWHCAAVYKMSLWTVILRFCLCGLSVWNHYCVQRGIWMPHFTLMLSLFFGYFCFSQPIVLRENGTWSVSRSITDKALLSGNFQHGQLCLSIVCLHIF